ncbi:hypothetical protein OD917_18770 [Flavobacterium sp. SH_e]|uniref:hypothetical protein n=1 Tax=Flavobacterium TaxID=237 RepID=UPI0021E3C48C|nr:hypothetical protein [Flavobacterium sp. SH_e]MCV2486982.1 hypothetical protein [Flavobacterium sp. SH_e]
MSYGGPKSGEECNCTYFSFRVESNGVPINPISVFEGILIYDKRPTFYDIVLYRPDSEMCSGYCHDGINEHYGGNINADCTATQYDAIGLISNQVLADPGADNSFCDKINLKTTGCTSPERFRWEYRIQGGSFQPMNINTGFNETFQFVKSAYIPESYVGNIDFRVLIDSNTAITGEEVYSNIISYNVIPCAPFLNKNPEPETTSCVYNKDGKVVLTFDRALIANERFEFNFYTADNALIPTPALSVDSTNKIYTFSGLALGQYYIKYQSFIGSQQTSVNKEPYPAFTIAPPSEFTFEIIETQPACHNEPGKIQLKATGGESPYYYTVDNGTEVEFNSISNVFTLTEGDHYIKVRDKKNCLSVTANDVQI